MQQVLCRLDADPGARLTNELFPQSKFGGKFALLQFRCWSSDRNKYLHMPRQHSRRAMC